MTVHVGMTASALPSVSPTARGANLEEIYGWNRTIQHTVDVDTSKYLSIWWR